MSTFLVTQAVLLFWWAVLYPGLVSPDSVDYVWQSTTGNWSTHHAVPYTALVWLSLQVTGGLGALTLVQTVAMAAALAYAATGLRRLGVPGWALLTTSTLLVALPPVGTFVVCVWKDVAFVIAGVFLLGTLARLARGPGRSGAYVMFGVSLALVALFRQNGFLVAAIVAALVAVSLRGARLRVAAAGGAAVTTALLLNLAVLPGLGVQNGLATVSTEALVGDIADAYARRPDTFPAADLAVMSAVAPLAFWSSSASCTSSDDTVMRGPYDRDAAAAHRGALVNVWWHLATRDPGQVLATRWCRGAVAWSPVPRGILSRNPSPWSARAMAARDWRVQDTPYGGAITSSPLNPTLYRVATRLIAEANRPALEWILWRGATLAYLAYAAVGFAAWRRRDPRLLLLVTPVLAVQLTVLAFNNVQAARYMALPYVLGVLLLPTALAGRRRQARVDERG